MHKYFLRSAILSAALSLAVAAPAFATEFPDISFPVVSALSPTAVTTGVATNFTATFSDDTGVTACSLIDTDADTNLGTVNYVLIAQPSGTATVSYTFTSAGTYHIRMTCEDAATHNGIGPIATVTVSAPDNTAPSVGSITPFSATVGSAASITVNYTDNLGVVQCRLYEDNGNTLLESTTFAANKKGTANFSHVFSMAGNHLVQVQCLDGAGNWNWSPILTANVQAAASVDTTAPTVGAVSPTAVSASTPTSFSASYSDTVGVTQCRLLIDGNTMWTSASFAPAVNGVISTGSTVAAGTGSHTFQMQCRDAAGNWGNGAQTVVTASGQSNNPPPPAGSIAYGSLVKLVCPDGAAADHPCKAVYYFGSDNKRHAFPNSKVYFTWYTDFGAVVEISATQMSAMALGKNVAYRPGTRMVKFTTDPKVYAVGAHGNLRWVSSEAVAVTLYGSAWNKKIDDIADTFYTDYTFGTGILNASDFNLNAEMNLASTIDLNY